MKGNDGTGNTIERDVWQTPQKLWDSLDKQYNFLLDCCANKDNSKCELFSNKFEDQVPLKTTMCWMNPPFSKAKEMFFHFVHSVSQGVCIYRCDNMETSIWQDIILPNATWVLIPKGRWSYEGFEGTGSRFASALIGFDVDIPKYVEGEFTILKVDHKLGSLIEEKK